MKKATHRGWPSKRRYKPDIYIAALRGHGSKYMRFISYPLSQENCTTYFRSDLTCFSERKQYTS